MISAAMLTAVSSGLVDRGRPDSTARTARCLSTRRCAAAPGARRGSAASPSRPHTRAGGVARPVTGPVLELRVVREDANHGPRIDAAGLNLPLRSPTSGRSTSVTTAAGTSTGSVRIPVRSEALRPALQSAAAATMTAWPCSSARACCSAAPRTTTTGLQPAADIDATCQPVVDEGLGRAHATSGPCGEEQPGGRRRCTVCDGIEGCKHHWSARPCRFTSWSRRA
jgi:hypothetical protein